MDIGEMKPFEISVPDSVLEDLHERLARARLPTDFANDDWRYGVEGGYLAELVEYWRTSYDWRAQEAAMNAFDNYKVTIDDVPIHFIYERGKGPNPTPLILTHGWPWTFWDYHELIGPLTDPASYGGDPADSFDVVIPSLPGYGFSVPITRTGVHAWLTADLWVTLMRDVLGYDRFAVGGGDWGAMISSQIGHKYPEHVIGVHLTLAVPIDVLATFPGAGGANIENPPTKNVPRGFPPPEAYTDADRHRLETMGKKMATAASHVVVNTNDPQTLAYALNDSPVGLCAHLIQRRHDWSDHGGDMETTFSKDDLLTTTMLYWVTESFGSSVRFYWEGARDPWQPVRDELPVVSPPTGVALFPEDLAQPPDSWMKQYYNLQRLTEMRGGGHFGPAEEPQALVQEIREFYRPLREG